MTTAYLTHDEVNAATAQELAARLPFDLVVLDVRQAHPTAARVVCDLDHLPAEVKAGLLDNAQDGVRMAGVAVHSYHLRSQEVRALRAVGVTVSRRLTGRLLGGAVTPRIAVAA